MASLAITALNRYLAIFYCNNKVRFQSSVYANICEEGAGYLENIRLPYRAVTPPLVDGKKSPTFLRSFLKTEICSIFDRKNEITNSHFIRRKNSIKIVSTNLKSFPCACVNVSTVIATQIILSG